MKTEHRITFLEEHMIHNSPCHIIFSEL